MTGEPAQSAVTQYRIALLIQGAIMAGPALFAIIAYTVRQGGEPIAMAPQETRLLLYIWAAVAVGATLAAVKLWQARVAPHIAAAEHREADPAAITPDVPPGQASPLLAALITVWAVLEGAGLLGVAFYLVTGSIPLVIGAVLLVWVGSLMTRPQPHWFGLAAA